MAITTKIGAVLAVTALAGCGIGQSRLNPLNWFGADRSDPIPQEQAVRATPGRPVVQQIVSLDIARNGEGALITAVGLPPTQGFWDADLVAVPSGDPTVLLFDFAIAPPVQQRRAGTQPSREVLVGERIPNADLAGIRTIAVRGQLNQRSVRR